MAGAVFYARVSKKDRRVVSESIHAQFSLMADAWRLICDDEDGECLFLSDDGYSGRDMARPAFGRLLGLVALGEVDVLIVKDFSRLCRDYLLFGMLSREIFVRYNVRFISVLENYDSFKNNPETLGMDVRSVFNEYYCHDISRKVKMAFNVKKENGDYSCLKPPFGYRWNDDRSGWEVVEAEAEVVREVFERFGAGESLRSIGGEIEKRYVTRKSNWEPAAVWQILHNPAYIGYQVWHKYETKTDGYRAVRAVPREDWELRLGTHKAIVQHDKWKHFILREESVHGKSLFTWHEQVSVKGLPDKKASKKGKRHIFHGLTKCGRCGRALCRGKRDKQMLCCNHCSTHEEKRIGTGRLYEVCLSEIYREYEVCISEIYREYGQGRDMRKVIMSGASISDREFFLHHFIRRIEIGEKGDIAIFWNFSEMKS